LGAVEIVRVGIDGGGRRGSGVEGTGGEVGRQVEIHETENGGIAGGGLEAFLSNGTVVGRAGGAPCRVDVGGDVVGRGCIAWLEATTHLAITTTGIVGLFERHTAKEEIDGRLSGEWFQISDVGSGNLRLVVPSRGGGTIGNNGYLARYIGETIGFVCGTFVFVAEESVIVRAGGAGDDGDNIGAAGGAGVECILVGGAAEGVAAGMEGE
jgi:hypothetical protein